LRSNLVCLHNPADSPELPSRSSSWQKNLDPEIKDNEKLLMSEKLLAGITNILHHKNVLLMEWKGPNQPPIQLYLGDTSLSLSPPLQEDDYSPPSCAKFTINGALPPDPTHLYGMCFSPRLNYFAYNFIWPTDIKILKCKQCSCKTTHTATNIEY
jgi:hypothetical protein